SQSIRCAMSASRFGLLLAYRSSSGSLARATRVYIRKDAAMRIRIDTPMRRRTKLSTGLALHAEKVAGGKRRQEGPDVAATRGGREDTRTGRRAARTRRPMAWCFSSSPNYSATVHSQKFQNTPV